MANERIEAAGLNLEERVIDIWRCATVVKGGKRFSFAVMSVIGNGAGILGVGYGKAREVPNAIEKSVKDAKKNLIRVSTFGSTIPHEVRGSYGASTVIMMPALARRYRTAKDNSGVERGPSKTAASHPFSAAVLAASSANCFE